MCKEGTVTEKNEEAVEASLNAQVHPKNIIVTLSTASVDSLLESFEMKTFISVLNCLELLERRRPSDLLSIA